MIIIKNVKSGVKVTYKGDARDIAQEFIFLLTDLNTIVDDYLKEVNSYEKHKKYK